MKSKFIQRSSKMTPLKFLSLMFFNSQQNQSLSLNQLSIEASTGCDVEITKQGLDQRMNDKAVEFLKLLLEKQLSNQISENLDSDIFKSFKRVRIKDSTKFDVNGQLSNLLPGFGGSASDASTCIQFEFDLKAGTTIDLKITPGNVPDSKDAILEKDNIKEGDLIIRDLGYYALEVLKSIQDSKAFYLSKLNTQTKAYEKLDNNLVEINFENIYQYMQKNNLTRIEKTVFIGKKTLLETRLIIELVPNEIYESRICKINSFNKKKGRTTTANYKCRSRFNLFITNADTSKLNTENALLTYRMRWQVELMFKVWKSTFWIHNVHKMKYERLMCQLLSKLLLIMVNWEIIYTYRSVFYRKRKELLSTDKSFKTLKNNAYKIRNLIGGSQDDVIDFIKWISTTFSKSHWIEKRKKRINFADLICLNI